MNKLKIAACGVDCNECAQYKVTMEHDLEAAELLVEWFREQRWIEKDENAEAVIRKAPLCKGCWDKTGVVFCGCPGLRACCEERQLHHCGKCGDFPCEKYIKWVDTLEHHEKAMEYLLSLRRTPEEKGMYI